LIPNHFNFSVPLEVGGAAEDVVVLAFVDEVVAGFVLVTNVVVGFAVVPAVPGTH
tara:strand:- start:377 stop:541 length:165 start_codon:yes stop_codon:yes gene_type:complete